MTTTSTDACAHCGRKRDDDNGWCPLCGALLDPPPAASVAPVEVRPATLPSTAEPSKEEQAKVLGLPAPWFFLAIGLLTAPLFAVLPLAGRMGWFLSSLVHEMGHSAVSWLFGMPSVPVIRLDGHAAAVHGEQVVFLLVMIGLGLGYLALQLRDRRLRLAGLLTVASLYPMLALTGAKELAHLLGGHCAELAFACLCLQRALSGGFTSSPTERGLYATLGWYMLGDNLLLTTGLIFSEATRAWYRTNGSFGLTNDYIRVGDQFFGGSLGAVAVIMTIVAACVLPLALLWWRQSRVQV